jgi:hypothetical protein
VTWDFVDGEVLNIRCVEDSEVNTDLMANLEMLTDHFGEDGFVMGHWEVSDEAWDGFIGSLTGYSESVGQG